MKLSISIGNGNAKVGRAKIVKTAHDMGIRTPLPDTPSLPIGADEVTVLDHTVAYATFPNLGKAVTPHAILEVRTGDRRRGLALRPRRPEAAAGAAGAGRHTTWSS